MPKKINWSVKVDVEEGPSISEKDTLQVQAYDTLVVTIPPGGTATHIELQPGDKDSVQVLVIKADHYDPKLTYSVTTGGTQVPLDSFQMLIGNGALGLFGNPPKELWVTNQTGKDVVLTILVGRKAIVEASASGTTTTTGGSTTTGSSSSGGGG